MGEQKPSVIPSWRELIEEAAPLEEMEGVIAPCADPSFSFFYMLSLSAVIGTLGLLADSTAVIIGAMIVAPLMNPIIALSFGLVSTQGVMVLRSLAGIIAGTLLTIAIAFLFTELIGWKLAGEEIISRMRPSLLDLGIAIAAGGAGAYAFTRPNVSSALAGIAIAVALVPPLCTVGIALALGQDASIEVGIIIDDLSARGPFLLFLTNFFGIVFAATLVFFWQYYRRTLAGAFAVIISFIGLALILRPLDTGTVDLLTHNMVNRSLITESYELLRGKEDIRFTHISTQVREKVVLVRADLVAAPGVINDHFVQELQRRLEKIIEQPVELELGVIAEKTLYAK